MSWTRFFRRSRWNEERARELEAHLQIETDDNFIWWLSTMGRLRPGWSIERATAHLQTISPTLFRETASTRLDPEQIEAYRKFRLEAVPRGGGFSSLRTRYEAPLWLLLGLSALVLLVACANLANLLLARAGARAREMAVRLATGASRGRMVRQLLAESLLLAAIGTLLGAILARVVSASLVSFLSTGRDPLSVPIALDWRVLGFTAATVIATTILFGLAPALRATSAPLESVMRTSSRGLTASRGRVGWQRALVVAQVALSLVMVLVALLFTLSLRNLTGVDTGFSVDNLVVTDIDFGGLAVPADRRLRLQRELLDGVRSIPGVTRSAIIRMVMREAILLVAVGLGLGALLATMASRAAKAMLFGLAPTDPLALVAAGAMLATTGIAATIIPALRAGRLQPTSALRED